jgi:DNA polymerase V
MVVLIDCDNFFASCERIMQPHLQSKPVAVLSNNDGCVVARSSEVKKAGVKMGQPYHECKAVLDSIGAEVLSANFLLYRHFAKRMQGILRAIPADSIEVYSIDESFLIIQDGRVKDPAKWAATLRQTILEWTGLPVSIGIGSSHALAKLASHVAKKQDGVCVIDIDNPATEAILKQTKVGDIWGIGRRLAPKLEVCGIRTAYDFTKLDIHSHALGLLDAPTKDLLFQLQGWSEGSTAKPAHQKSIMYSRSFGASITDKNALRASLAVFTSELAAKLRKKELVADRMIISIRYRVPGKIHGKGVATELTFGEWSDDTFVLTQTAEAALDMLFESDKSYIKAMVLLPELRTVQQLSLLSDSSNYTDDLLKAMDALVRRYGAAGPHVATTMLNESWRGKRSAVSPYNHAEWQSLPVVSSS